MSHDDKPDDTSDERIALKDLWKAKRRKNYLLAKTARKEATEKAKAEEESQKLEQRREKDRELWQRMTTAKKLSQEDDKDLEA